MGIKNFKDWVKANAPDAIVLYDSLPPLGLPADDPTAPAVEPVVLVDASSLTFSICCVVPDPTELRTAMRNYPEFVRGFARGAGEVHNFFDSGSPKCKKGEHEKRAAGAVDSGHAVAYVGLPDVDTFMAQLGATSFSKWFTAARHSDRRLKSEIAHATVAWIRTGMQTVTPSYREFTVGDVADVFEAPGGEALFGLDTCAVINDPPKRVRFVWKDGVEQPTEPADTAIEADIMIVRAIKRFINGDKPILVRTGDTDPVLAAMLVHDAAGIAAQDVWVDLGPDRANDSRPGLYRVSKINAAIRALGMTVPVFAVLALAGGCDYIHGGVGASLDSLVVGRRGLTVLPPFFVDGRFDETALRAFLCVSKHGGITSLTKPQPKNGYSLREQWVHDLQRDGTAMAMRTIETTMASYVPKRNTAKEVTYGEFAAATARRVMWAWRYYAGYTDDDCEQRDGKSVWGFTADGDPASEVADLTDAEMKIL